MTKSQYRALLIKHGVPEVYAHMAAENFSPRHMMMCGISKYDSAAMLIYGGFLWGETKQGSQFWNAVFSNSWMEAK